MLENGLLSIEFVFSAKLRMRELKTSLTPRNIYILIQHHASCVLIDNIRIGNAHVT